MRDRIPTTVGGFLDSTVDDEADLRLLLAVFAARGPLAIEKLARRTRLAPAACTVRLERLRRLDLVALEDGRARFLARSRTATDALSWIRSHRWRCRPSLRTHIRSMRERLDLEESAAVA